jgi:hypothetical protein
MANDQFGMTDVGVVVMVGTATDVVEGKAEVVAGAVVVGSAME